MTIILVAVFFLLLLTVPVITAIFAYGLMTHLQKRKSRDQRISKDLFYVMTLNRRGMP
jgi:hypothetical protein